MKMIDNVFAFLQYRSYLVRDRHHSAKYGAADILDARSADVLINIHAYGNSGDAELEVCVNSHYCLKRVVFCTRFLLWDVFAGMWHV